MTDAEYQAWLVDVTRDPYRILLIELDHSTGTLCLASDDWMSETYQPYYGWLLSEPYLEDSLENFLGVGDIEAINANFEEVNWMSLNWRGYRCRWYYGDRTWPKSDFKRIATALIDGCRATDGRIVTFDLIEGGQQLNRTFRTTDYTSTISVPSTIELIMGWCGLDPVVLFQNVLDAESASQVNISFTPDSIALTEIKRLTDSMGAYTRFSQTGQLEVFIPEITASPRVLTEDDIMYGSINMIEIIQPVKTVVCELYDGTRIEAATTADTGELDEELVFKTVLRRTGDATLFVNKKKLYYSTSHAVWSMQIFDIASQLQVGDDVRIEHSELTGEGIVTRIQRAPLSQYTLIEVTI